MSKRYIGWGVLIGLALALNVYASPVARVTYEDPQIEEFRASPGYEMHMKGLRNTKIRMLKQELRAERRMARRKSRMHNDRR